MAEAAEKKKEPIKLKIILPLAGAIIVLAIAYFVLNLSKSPFSETTTPQLVESFHSYAIKNKNFDHFKLFTSQKRVNWDQGPSLAGFLKDLDGSDKVSSVALSYQIPVFINLTGDWIFNLANSNLTVQVPMPTFGDAVLDASSLEIKFKSAVSPEQESLIREALKENLASYRVALDSSSRASLEQESRVKVQELLQVWLTKSFSKVPEIKYQISFSGSEASDFIEEP
jgi:hypothetical protein